MVKFGFVKVIAGKSSGRIGRFVGYDLDDSKAKIAFGFENDVLTYTNYKFYSLNSISNEIQKQDLIDRYFDIRQELKAIDVRGHPEIKKYSAEHTSLISELNMICGLFNQIFSIAELDKHQKDQNVIIFCSFLDRLWLNEFILDLELKNFNVAIDDHSLQEEKLNERLFDSLELAVHFIILESAAEDADFCSWERSFFSENIDSATQTLSIITADRSRENIKKGTYYFGENFSSQYEKSFYHLTQRLEFMTD